MGVITPFGSGGDVLLQALRDGACASRAVTTFPAEGAGIAALAETSQAHRDRKVGLAVEAALQLEGVRPDAWIHLGIGLEVAHLEDFGPLLTESGLDWSRATPRATFRTPLDTAAFAVAEALGTTGPVTIDVSACAAGGLSLLTGLQLLRAGLADQVVVGGVDAMVNPLGYGGMERLGALAADGVCRPFDAGRAGLLMGEGAALFLLERGEGGLGRLLGGASTQDGWRTTAPRPDGTRAARAIRGALEDAGVTSVDWVNAHGTGTPLNDPAELAALRLAGLDVPVRSLKGALGHAMAAAGALEAAATWVCLADGLLPGTVGFRSAGVDTVGQHGADARSFAADTVLSTSFGFGGQNVALVLGR